MFWSPDFLISAALEVGSLIKSFEYEINGSWKTAQIISTGRESSGGESRVYNYFLLEIPSDVSGRITGFRLIDRSGNVLGSKKENITKSAGTAMIYKFKMRIFEEGK